MSNVESCQDLAGGSISLQLGDRAPESRSHDLPIPVSQINTGSRGVPRAAPMGTQGDDEGPLPELTAAMDKDAIIRQLMEELNEKEEKNKRIIETMACVSTTASQQESQLRKDIELLKAQKEALKEQLYNLEHCRDGEKGDKSVDQFQTPEDEVEMGGMIGDRSSVGLTAGSVSHVRSRTRPVTSRPTVNNNDHVTSGLNGVTSRINEEDEDFKTAFDFVEDFDETAREQFEELISPVKNQTSNMQTQTDGEQRGMMEEGNKEQKELIQQQKQTIRARDEEIREQRQMLDNLRSVISSMKSELSTSDKSPLLAEITALQMQVFEHAEAYRKEHNDRVLLHQRKKRSDRDAKVYRKERDGARRQVEDLTIALDAAREEVMRIKDQHQRGRSNGGRFNDNTFAFPSDWTARDQGNTTATNREQLNSYNVPTRPTASAGERNGSVHSGHAASERGSALSDNDWASSAQRGHHKTHQQRDCTSENSVVMPHGQRSIGKTHHEKVDRQTTSLKEPEIQVKVTASSDSQPSQSASTGMDSNWIIPSETQFGYQRCGAVIQGSTTLPGSSSGANYLQCDHASCTTADGVPEERQIIMTSSLDHTAISSPPVWWLNLQEDC